MKYSLCIKVRKICGIEIGIMDVQVMYWIVAQNEKSDSRFVTFTNMKIPL